ncbi:MAG: phosphoribosylformimino-5-aminoimidazole carboxamide ribotide isomerase [Fusobacteria bacterium]|nr:MAG: phosphoribosylformimino-5-aminoimidazole carboxamide ribotide isomerase [Fusobacteriota bacterium]KAF0229720.1 MAG: phosphoribosylformimino-5-aminoimidazole carboxamide ribotide [Fusobacteriota bacterium]
MVLVPAIDMLDGQCIRLYKGDYNMVTVYGDPVEIGKKWQDMGAEMIHLVDLDGAEAGNPKNLEIIKKLVETLDIPLEIGGGIRTMDTIKMYLDLGVERVILGTAAVENMALVACAAAVYGNRIVVGIDAENGIVKTKGWLNDTKIEALALAYDMKELGIERIIYTDINRDGTLTGPNLAETEALAKESGLKITASGGMSSMKDIKAVMKLEQYGVDEVILGKALYEDKIDLVEALKLTRK